MNIDQTPHTVKESLKLDLPVLPHTFLLGLGLYRQVDDISIDEVVELIQYDPGAVARVLRVVNSAYYGLRNEVTSVHKAVVGLGPEVVLGIVMSVSLVDMKGHLQITTSQLFQKLVRHSVAVGFFVRRIASMSKLAGEKVPKDFLNEVFTLGLLHDFGKIVLFHNFPDKAVQFYGQEQEVDVDEYGLLCLEEETFGINHVDAGSFLMDELNFLDSMVAAVSYHHSYDEMEKLETGLQHLINIVVAGNKLANTLGFEYNRVISRKANANDSFWDNLIDQGLFDETDKASLFKDLFDLQALASAYVSEIT